MKPANLYDRIVLERNEIDNEIRHKYGQIESLNSKIEVLKDRKFKLESILEDFGKHVCEHYEENKDEVDT